MPVWLSALVITTSTAPAVWPGVVAVIDVLLPTLTPVAAVPPKVTVAPVAKPVPVMVTEVPPLVDPEVGVIAVGFGGGGGGLDELWTLPRKAAICITHGTDELRGAAAL